MGETHRKSTFLARTLWPKKIRFLSGTIKNFHGMSIFKLFLDMVIFHIFHGLTTVTTTLRQYCGAFCSSAFAIHGLSRPVLSFCGCNLLLTSPHTHPKTFNWLKSRKMIKNGPFLGPKPLKTPHNGGFWRFSLPILRFVGFYGLPQAFACVIYC